MSCKSLKVDYRAAFGAAGDIAIALWLPPCVPSYRRPRSATGRVKSSTEVNSWPIEVVQNASLMANWEP